MVRSVRLALTLVAAMSLWPGEARADVIVIDPSDYTLGSDLSTLFTGVTMSRLTQRDGSAFYDPLSSGVFASEHYHAPDRLTLGPYSYPEEWARCHQATLEGQASLSCVEGFSVLELRFDAPTNFVQITSAWFSDGPGLRAYDVHGSEVARCDAAFGGTGGGCASTVAVPQFGANSTTSTIQREQRDISRVVFGGLPGISTPTEVRYRVPEPSTLLFVALGIAGLLKTRR
jgi:hypothetical protein